MRLPNLEETSAALFVTSSGMPIAAGAPVKFGTSRLSPGRQAATTNAELDGPCGMDRPAPVLLTCSIAISSQRRDLSHGQGHCEARLAAVAQEAFADVRGRSRTFGVGMLA